MTKTLVSLVALIAATPALAQTDPTLPGTDADGRSVVVTASRSGDAVPIDQTGASATVLSADDLEARQTRIVSDVLRDVPGVAVSRAGSPGSLTQIRLRGTESNHVLVLIDGIEASDPYQGEFDFGTLLADEDARIEVLRGQQSSLYGSDAIGGVINYITLTGREAPGLSARIEGGSMGTVSGGARVAGVAGDLDYAVSGSALTTDGYPVAEGGSRDVGATLVNGTGKVTWTPSTAFKLTAVGRYSHARADVADSDSDPTSATFGQIIDSPGAYYTNQAFYGLVRGELSLLDGRWNSALSGQYTDTARDNYDGGALAFGDRGRRYKGSFVSSIRLGEGAIRHQLTAAVDVEREDFRNSSQPSPFVFTGWRHTDNVGIVGEYEMLLGDRASLGASVRQDLNDRFQDATTYRIQGSYRLRDGTRVHAAYGTGIKNPGYFELYGFDTGKFIGNPDLRPEKSKGWEAGLEQDIGHKATIGATYFDSRLVDEIYTIFPAPDFVATPSNRDTLSRQHGVEVYASAQPIPELRFDLAYTYTHATEDGINEVRRPHHIASVNTTVFSPDKRFAGTLSIRYNGRQDDQAFTDPSFVPVPVSLQEYVLVNLNAEYKLTDHFTVYGRVENLFNESYEEVFSYAGQGRTALAGVKARF